LGKPRCPRKSSQNVFFLQILIIFKDLRGGHP
jgi:hypothetical protein